MTNPNNKIHHAHKNLMSKHVYTCTVQLPGNFQLSNGQHTAGPPLCRRGIYNSLTASRLARVEKACKTIEISVGSRPAKATDRTKMLVQISNYKNTLVKGVYFKRPLFMVITNTVQVVRTSES